MPVQYTSSIIPQLAHIVIGGNRYTAAEAHKVMWRWLALYPERKKQDFFIIHKVPQTKLPLCYCYACDVANDKCNRCPIVDWREYALTHPDDVPCMDGVYWKWATTESISETLLLAKEIAEMIWEEVPDDCNNK